MREEFDSVLVDRFKVLDQVPVPDTWSRIRKTAGLLTLLDLESAAPTEPGSDPGSETKTRDIAAIVLEPTCAHAGRRGRRRRVARGVLAIAVAAAVVTTMVVISRDHTTAPADTPIPSPLEDPSPNEVALASNASVYVPATGPSEVTATRGHVSLRTCAVVGSPEAPCDEGWAYAAGSVQSAAVHYGLLGRADDLVLSPLDDRLFVASSASLSEGPGSAPAAWLIDSQTGQRGALTWRDEPTTLQSLAQGLVLFPAPGPVPYFTFSFERFLPRVVDRRDWTIRPLAVPDDATAAQAIHQPGSGRIWVGTAPDGGDVGLAYTDNGGESWTNVELPMSLRHSSEELLNLPPGTSDALVVAATRDHVAVSWAWGERTSHIFVTNDAGESWKSVEVDPPANGTGLFVLADGRLIVVFTLDPYAQQLLASSTSSDWSQLAKSDEFPDELRSHLAVTREGVVVNYASRGMEPSALFSTDLTEWWTIPKLQLICGDC